MELRRCRHVLFQIDEFSEHRIILAQLNKTYYKYTRNLQRVVECDELEREREMKVQFLNKEGEVIII